MELFSFIFWRDELRRCGGNKIKKGKWRQVQQTHNPSCTAFSASTPFLQTYYLALFLGRVQESLTLLTRCACVFCAFSNPSVDTRAVARTTARTAWKLIAFNSSYLCSLAKSGYVVCTCVCVCVYVCMLSLILCVLSMCVCVCVYVYKNVSISTVAVRGWGGMMHTHTNS